MYKKKFYYQFLNLKSFKGEIWKPIKGYEKLYHISNLGRVKSLARTIKRKNNTNIIIHEKILRQGIAHKRGNYLLVSLRNQDNGKSFLVHRLVAIAFIKNPLKKRTVNHKKGIVHDNRAISLEWNTDSENNKHAFAVLGRKNKPLRGGENPRAKKIICITNNTVYNCMNDAARELKCKQQKISLVCQGKRKIHKGYVFEYFTSPS